MKKTFFIFTIFISISALCCGPYIPPAYMNFEDPEYSPRVNIAYEMKLLGRHFCPDAFEQKFTKHVVDRDKVLEMEARWISRSHHINKEDADKFLKNLKALHSNSVKGVSTENFEFDYGFEELVLYEKGLYEMNKEPDALPPPSWKKILEQRFSSSDRLTWVLYMLGNATIKKDPALAHSYYQKLRDAVNNGAYDSQGLAYESFRNEYFYTIKLCERLKIALYCFNVYSNFGEASDSHTVLEHIRYMLDERYSKITEDEKKELLNDPVAREVAILFYPKFFGEYIDDTKFICAERLALYAYKSGDKEKCLWYLERSPDNSRMKLWLLGRFARQERNYEKAALYLKRWLDLYGRTEEEFLFLKNDNELKTTVKNDVAALLGSVLVRQENLQEALYTFILAEDYADAIYVAEQVMNLDDLVRFCSIHSLDENNYTQRCVLTVLARRLMRASRPEEAMKVFPENIKPLVAKYCELSKKGNDCTLSKNERALAFLKIAVLFGKYGELLLATFLYPDYIGLAGYHHYSRIDKLENLAAYQLSLLPPVPRRYNMTVSDFYLRAATLTDDLDTRILCLRKGGGILKGRYPLYADVFYKMICDCRPHPFAEETANAKWFPDKELPENMRKIYEEAETTVEFKVDAEKDNLYFYEEENVRRRAIFAKE